jgi:hypothetical protein
MLHRVNKSNAQEEAPNRTTKTPRFRQKVLPIPEAVPSAADAANTNPSGPVATQGKRRYAVTINVFPWAEVWMNGKQIRAGASNHTLQLPRGEHELELRHDLAAPVKRKIRLPGSGQAGGQTLTTKIRRFRPARLTISTTLDGTVTALGQRFPLLAGSNEININLPDGRFREQATLVYEAQDCRRQFVLRLEAGGLHRWQVDCSSP